MMKEEGTMKRMSIVGFFFTVGLLMVLKVFQDRMLRFNDPIGNLIVFVSVIIVVIIYLTPWNRQSD